MAVPALPGVAGALSSVDDATRAARERIELTREQLADRAAEAGQEARALLEGLDVEPAVKRAQVGFWSGVRVLGSSLAVLPSLLLRVVRTLSAAGGELADRGHELSERGRDVAAAVPPSRRAARRMKLRVAGFAGAGFMVGVVVGWLLARRGGDEVVYEESVTTRVSVAPDTTTDAADGPAVAEAVDAGLAAPGDGA